MKTSEPFVVWENEIDPRIELLRRNNFHLEAFYLFSNTLEFLLRSCIEGNESWLENLSKKSKVTYKKIPEKDLEGKTLGELIKLFSKFCGDKVLLNELNNFNSFRIKIAHKIIKGNLANLNTEAEKYYKKYNFLVAMLCKHGYEVTTKIVNSTKRKIKKTSSKLLS